MFRAVVGGADLRGSVGRIPLPPTPSDAVHRRFDVRPHELDPMDHANNAVYLDWLEESIVGSAEPAAARAATSDLPRRYRMEYALAVEAGAELDGAAWPDGAGWCYRLAGADGSADRFRARVATGPAARDATSDPAANGATNPEEGP